MNSWTYRLVNSMASAVEWLLDEDPPSAASGPAPPVAPRKAEPPRPHLPPPAPGETAAELSEVALLERWRAHWRVAPLPPDGRVHRSPELTALVSAGVPATDRAAFWCACAGVDVVPGEYERLVTQALNGGASRLASVQIEKDLNRTFEGVASVRIPEAEAVGALRRVLSAFAVHDPVIGYTQSCVGRAASNPATCPRPVCAEHELPGGHPAHFDGGGARLLDVGRAVQGRRAQGLLLGGDGGRSRGPVRAQGKQRK